MNTNQSMTDFVKESVKRLDEGKLICLNRTFTTKEVFTDVACVATFLKHNGVKKGDSVIICMPNLVQAVVALYAINSVGAVANVVHPKIGTEGLIRIAEETETKWIFIFDRIYLKHRKELIKRGITAIICRVSDCMAGSKALRLTEPLIMCKKAVPYNATLVKPGNFDVEITGEDPAVYLHSSGTTGEPKTVVLSNKALNELVSGIYDKVKPLDGESMLMTLPLFHGFGLGVCVHLMMTFGKIVLLPVFKAKKAVKLMHKYEINYMAVVPSMLRKLMEIKGFSGKSVRYLKNIFIGGDKPEQSLMDAVKMRLTESDSRCKVCEGYGLSEIASVTHINTDCKIGSVGSPLNGVKVKIINDGKEAQIGKDGIIYLSSPSMMSGYLNAKANFVTDENGTKWLNTGDVGSVDKDGFLYYKGREKRMVKIGGVNIYPQETENAANSLSEVDCSCAVRTVWNGKPALKLLVKLKRGVKLSGALRQRLCDEISSKIMPYAVPKFIEQTDDLKMTGSGKTDYRYYEEQEPKLNK